MKSVIEPRGLPLEIAADYVGLSKTTFASEVKKGLAPGPTWLTKKRKVWLKEKLDAYLDRKDKGAGVSDTWLDRTEKLRLSISGARNPEGSNTRITAARAK